MESDERKANDKDGKRNKVNEVRIIVKNRKTKLKKWKSSSSFNQPKTTEDPKKGDDTTITGNGNQQREAIITTKRVQQ